MKFSKLRYDENDPQAKELMIKYFQNYGYSIISEVENFEHDLIIEKEARKYFIEVEMKRSLLFTDSNSFKYDTVSFTSRKNKLHLLAPFTYYIICPETEWAIYCHSSIIYQNKYKVMKTNKSRKNEEEEYYHVPKQLCTFIDLKI
jgi:hypothetical protein